MINREMAYYNLASSKSRRRVQFLRRRDHFEEKDSDQEAKQEYEFVEPPTENQICSICMKVLCQPHLINCCEQQYCQECLETWLRKNRTCPHCRSRDHSHILMKETSRKIGELKVYCPNKKLGCNTILKICEYDNHLSKTNDEGCLFVHITCPNQCDNKIFRGDMKKHTKEHCPRRSQTCAHCRKVGEYQYISGNHVMECTEYPVACPQKCGATVPRKGLEIHKNTCPLENVPCMYYELGCKVQLQRKDVMKHMESNLLQHTTEIAKSFFTLKKELDTIKEEFVTMRESHVAISEVLKQMPSDNLHVAKIRTLVSNITEIEIGNSLFLTLSKSNEKAGQHFIKVAGMTLKYQWEDQEDVRYRPMYRVSLSVKVEEKITPCDVKISIYSYEQNEDRTYNELAKMCCFSDSISKDQPFKSLKTVELFYTKEGDTEMELQFLQHNSRLCGCDCHRGIRRW